MTKIIRAGLDYPPVDDSDQPKTVNQLLTSCRSPSNDDANPNKPPANLVFIVTSDTIETLVQTSNKFGCACADSSAQVPVIGKPHASAYVTEYGSSPHLGETKRAYHFGDKWHVDLSTINIDIPVPSSHSHYVNVWAWITSFDVLFLMSLNVLTHIRAILEFKKEHLSGKFDYWPAPLVKRMVHS